ncbi:MAG: hypothetical protein J6M06_01030 [Synergistaceae bacterium]|nr:hypothetical protein [Synergistaceae bacterium]
MNEITKYEEQKKKMQGICDEHGLVFRLTKNRYPIVFTIRPAKDLDSQMDMLENEEEVGYRSPDAAMIWTYPGKGDDVFDTRVTGGTFTIGRNLRTKIESILLKMISYWQQYFFRDVMEKAAIKSGMEPVIDEDDAEDEDIPPEDDGELPEDAGSGELPADDYLPPLEDEDPDVAEATKIVRTENKATLSLLQRRMNIGYAKAARIMNKLEELGVVGEFNGPNSREVLPYDVPEDEEDTENG